MYMGQPSYKALFSSQLILATTMLSEGCVSREDRQLALSKVTQKEKSRPGVKQSHIDTYSWSFSTQCYMLKTSPLPGAQHLQLPRHHLCQSIPDTDFTFTA